MRNEMEITFDALSSNEGFARVAVVSFIANLNPTLEEISDIKTGVSEAVTNSIIHAYDNNQGKVTIKCMQENYVLHITIVDYGKGIEDVEKAMEPLFTTSQDLERSGMGFSFMEAFMDDLEVESTPGKGTTVRMIKKIGLKGWLEEGDEADA